MANTYHFAKTTYHVRIIQLYIVGYMPTKKLEL